MHFLQSLGPVFVILSTLSLLSYGASLDCKNLRIDNVLFDVSPLGGVRHVFSIDKEEGNEKYQNTTFTFDLCKPIKDSSISKPERCEQGAYVCAVQRDYLNEGQEGEPEVSKHWSIAGEFLHGNGHNLDPSWQRIGKSDSNQDQEQDIDGVRIILNGGSSQEYGQKVPQKAVFELICDQNYTGLEGQEDDPKKGESSRLKSRDDEVNPPDGDGEKKPEGDSSPLQFRKYSHEKDTGVLRISWRTKYACEGEAEKPKEGDDKGKSSSSGWGFFTWFIIVLFLGTATYLIFGSWLNYSRHGARGWDLLPHSDTIRDIPYILRDVAKRVVSTVQGGGRGGYNQI